MAEPIRMRPSKRRADARAALIQKLQAASARARVDASRMNGRAWINGSEVGGSDPRYAHLNRSYD